MERDRSDEQLMLAFRGGEARAFELLVLRHRGPVFNFIYRYTGHRPKAEELLQESWLRVIRGAQQYRAKAFSTWLYTIARNLCLDHARREADRAEEPLDNLSVDEEENVRLLPNLVADGPAMPDRALRNARLRPLLEQAIMSLPPEQREVFVLREYSGVQFKEIAAVTGCSVNTVKSRMLYALAALREKLEELGVDGDLVEEDGRASG